MVGLLVWHVDRLCRNVRDLEDVVDLVNGKVVVQTVSGGEIDLETPEGRLQARMLAWRDTNPNIGMIGYAALEQNADLGKDSGGRRKYGWHDDGTVQPTEAAIVAELTQRVIRGESCRSLAGDLRRRNVPSARGAAWHASAVKAIVCRARNAGLVERHVRGQQSGQWEAARALLTDPGRRLSPGNAPTRLLTGLMTCGVEGCGAPVRTGGTAQGHPEQAVYRSTVSPHLTRRADFVDDLVAA